MEQLVATISTKSKVNCILLPGETILKIIQSPKHKVTHPPSTLRELYRLAKTKIGNDVGKFGPVIASLSIEGMDSDKSEEFHLYEALFGRDALRVAMDLLPIYPKLTRATIITLAELQGVDFDSNSEEEPGRIIHESRTPTDPMRAKITKKRGWDWPYYGSVDATVEFVRVLVAYCNNSPEGTAFLNETYKDKDHTIRKISDALIYAVDWIKYRINSNHEGIIESLHSSPNGIENQVWKDSWDSYFHSNGKIANYNMGVASIEVQRVTYDALLDTSEIYERVLNKKHEANELRVLAENLKKVIFQHFWTEEKGGYFILGTDRDKNGNLRKLKVRASNMGHLLRSRLLESDSPDIIRRRESILRNLFSPQMLTPFGIRTLATDEYRYRPGAYHNGSVWLWDNFLIIQGLHRHNYHLLAKNLTDRLLKIVEETKKFPEFIRGDSTNKPILNSHIIDVWDDNYQKLNRIEQPPQEVQAWSVTAMLAIEYYNETLPKNDEKTPRDKFEAQLLKTLYT